MPLLPCIDPRPTRGGPPSAASPIAGSREARQAALAKPMPGCPWAGEPSIERGRQRRVEAPAWFDARAAAYAMALLRRRDPDFAAGDLSHLRMRFKAPGTVLFVTDVPHRGRLRSVAVAAVLLPVHVTGFDPRARPAPARPLPRQVPRLAPPFHRVPESPPMALESRSARSAPSRSAPRT